MKKILAKVSIPVLVAGSIGVASVAVASPALAEGCHTYPYVVGVTRLCDGPMQPDGWFHRCNTTVVLGFGGPNCYMVDSNNLAGNPPYIWW